MLQLVYALAYFRLFLLSVAAFSLLCLCAGDSFIRLSLIGMLAGKGGAPGRASELAPWVREKTDDLRVSERPSHTVPILPSFVPTYA